MADEQVPRREEIAAGKPSCAKPMVTSITLQDKQEFAGKEGQSPPSQASKDTVLPRRSEFAVLFCWLMGSFLILICGWGFLGFCWIIDRRLHLGRPWVTVIAAFLASFVLFYALERKQWLSRFMGLRLGPRSSQMGEAAFFWLTGIAGLLIRSSDQPAAEPKTPTEMDSVREVVETIVFVVVLVLLLKTFLVEAFVIPTGSMAETLWGYQKSCTCEKCHFQFVINCSSELEPQRGEPPFRVDGGVCPNCRHENRFFPIIDQNFPH